MGKKLFIVLLILCALLYFGALGVGVMTSDGSSGGSTDMSAGDNPVVGAMGRVLSVFAPSLLLSGANCNGQAVTGQFRLNESKPSCYFRLGNDGAKFRRGELVFVSSTTAKVYVYVDGSKFDGDPPKGCRNQISNSGFQLRVQYRDGTSPLTSNAPDSPSGRDCWLPQGAGKPIGLTVQDEDGGYLRLQCVGCSAKSNRELRLRVE